MPALTKVLKDENWMVRSNAAKALGKIGSAAKESIPALTELLNDENEEVREAARGALEKIQDSPEPSSG